MTRAMQLGFVLIGLIVSQAFAQGAPPAAEPQSTKSEFARLPWEMGADGGKIGGKAIVALGERYMFLSDAGTRRFLELTGNPPRDSHYTLAPKGGKWFAVFHFVDSGHVKDDEKLDPDALLQSMRDSEKEENAERKKLGYGAMSLDGWVVAPHYDAVTKRLEWGTRFHDEKGNSIVNYTTRVLGRTGFMVATLVSDPVNLDADTKAFQDAMGGFQYNGGERYDEFRAGDKVAEYGLGALVLGGAAAAAVKTGAGKGLIKLIIAGAVAAFAAVSAFVKKLFGRKTGSA
jgi:uncharacterized membrane-anchored protein